MSEGKPSRARDLFRARRSEGTPSSRLSEQSRVWSLLLIGLEFVGWVPGEESYGEEGPWKSGQACPMGPSGEPGLRKPRARPSEAQRVAAEGLRTCQRPCRLRVQLGSHGAGRAPTEQPRRASQWRLRKGLYEGCEPRPRGRFLDSSTTDRLNRSPFAVGYPVHLAASLCSAQ